MFCNHCGNELPEAGAFCPACGAPRSQAPVPKKPSSKAGRVVSIVIIVLLVAVLALQNFGVLGLLAPQEPETQRIEGGGFDSPEDAVLAYIEALKAGDISGVLSTFAVETYVEEVDAEALLERMQAYNNSLTVPLTGGDYESSLLCAKRAGQIVQGLCGQLLTYSGQQAVDDFYYNMPVFFDDDLTPADFLDAFQKSGFRQDLSALEFQDFLDPTDLNPAFYTDANLQLLRRNCDLYGCDDYEPVAAQVALGGEDWVVAMDCAEYDGRWYNLSVGGNIGALLGMTPDAGGMMPLQ